jgi:serine protease SohB
LEFLAQYGLFLAKTVTLVVAIMVVVAFVVAAGMKKNRGDKGQIKVVCLNDEIADMADALKAHLLDEKAIKDENKQRKKNEKAEQKAKKQAPEGERKQRIFVLDFDGDIKASAAESLRHVVTAVLAQAGEQDEVVLRLESQGGMVHSYGFAASQLARIREKNIPLTVCVDKVAASGGYMMACVASHIIAAPFAIVGSIGVVASLPNFHRVLKKHDVDYEMLTAGEYKRTLTVLGENTEKGRQKFQEDLEDTHDLFKAFIHEHRPALDVEIVATGEVWFGSRALAVGLIDAVSTSDAYITARHPAADIFAVSYEQKKTLAERVGVNTQKAAEALIQGVFEKLSARYWAR